MRERLTAHRSNPVCAGCHKITDPIGLALENFDGAGQYRKLENGTAIDTSGGLGRAQFENVEEFETVMRNDPAITSCLVQRVYHYGVGRPMTQGEKPLLGYFEDRFAKQNYNYVALLKTIATSNAFYRIDQLDIIQASNQAASIEAH
jgi:hypothetical protein